MAMQIRAQLAAEGFPLYGDTLYSSLADGASPQVREHQHQYVCQGVHYMCMTLCAAQGIYNEAILVKCRMLQVHAPVVQHFGPLSLIK